MAYLTANDSAILAELAEGPGGFNVGPPVPYDSVGMNWAAGRRCTDTPDPGPIAPPDVRWADGTPMGPYPQPPTASEWRALKAEHGLPCTMDGVTVGNWPKKEN